MSAMPTSTTRQTYKILAWNANGLLGRKAELTQFLNSEQIDIAMIAETHLTSRTRAEIANYNIFTCNHPMDAAHGGAAVYIKKTIAHYEASNYCTDHIQAACITAKLHCGTSVNIAAVYSPPKHRITASDYEVFFQHLGEKWIIGGDFNAKHHQWGSRVISTKGRELYQALINTNSNCISKGDPTYWPADINKLPDCIDFFILHGMAPNYIDIDNISDLSSDHTPIVLTLSDTLLYKQTTPKLTSKYTDWDIFREEVDKRINLHLRLKTPVELEEALANFSSVLVQAANIATPDAGSAQTSATSYPLKVRKLVKERRKARHRWQCTRDPAHKRIFNQLSKETSKLIRSINEKSFNDFLLSLDCTKDANYSLWKVAKASKKPPSYVPPLRKHDGSWARDDLDRAETFASHLLATFQPNDITTDINPVIEHGDGDNEIKPFSPGEVKHLIKSLNPRKAPGADLITARILQEVPGKGIVLLTYLFNTALRLRYIPTEWKKAKIIMLPKPGKPLEKPDSYRPISLLSSIAKLFEKLFLRRLKHVTDELNIVPDHQFGFRNKHSTVEQIHRVSHTIRQALETKQHCPTIFLDVKQAFDRVWIDGLLHKVSRYLPSQYVQILESYLKERYFQVQYGEATSSVKPINAGVPQGSVLGPHLYILYTSDIPVTKSVIVATFADDTTVLSPHENYDTATSNLQEAVDVISNWTKRWKIQLNSSKTVRVDYSLRSHGCNPTYIDGTPVTRADSAKYLGMHLDSKLNWRRHLTKKRDDLNAKFRSLFWLCSANSRLTLSNKRLLYLTVLRPVWTYGIQLWACAADSNLQIIQRFQNKVLRKMVGAQWYIRNDVIHYDLRIETVAEVAGRLARSYEKRLHEHPNSEVLQLLEFPATRRLKRKYPVDVVT